MQWEKENITNCDQLWHIPFVCLLPLKYHEYIILITTQSNRTKKKNKELKNMQLLSIKFTNKSISLYYINNQKYKNKIIDKNKWLKLKICSEMLQ